MKLLFDQNLSPTLVMRLADLFPDASHVQAIDLDCASDDRVWEHARLNEFAIVTKDEDFNNLSVMRGCPPKVIWLQLGNFAQLLRLRLRFVPALLTSSRSKKTLRSARLS